MRLSRVLLTSACALTLAGAASADTAATPPANPDLGAQQSAVQQSAPSAAPATQLTSANAYSGGGGWTFAPAAGAEFGIGTVVPTMHTPALQVQGKLGVAWHGPSWAFVAAGQGGVAAALNVGSATPYYGYLVRVPFELALEAIYSHYVSYTQRLYINLHMGGLIGTGFILAATCNAGNCAYLQPALTTPSWGLRSGLSFSSGVRSSMGLFVTWHNDHVACPVGTPGAGCTTWLSTVIWSVGWTLF